MIQRIKHLSDLVLDSMEHSILSIVKLGIEDPCEKFEPCKAFMDSAKWEYKQDGSITKLIHLSTLIMLPSSISPTIYSEPARWSGVEQFMLALGYLASYISVYAAL